MQSSTNRSPKGFDCGRKHLQAWLGSCRAGITACSTLAKSARTELTRINKPIDPAHLDQVIADVAIVLSSLDAPVTTVAGRGKGLDVDLAAVAETGKTSHH